MHQTELDQRVDELLELIWELDEEGEHRESAVLEAAPRRAHEPEPALVLDHLATRGMVERRGAELRLSSNGAAVARSLVRRQRLAERLLHDVLAVNAVTVASDACRFEHVLSPEVTDRICTLLGHPPVCPHGRPIPRGPCCGTFRTDVEPLTLRLADMQVGTNGRVGLLGSRRGGRLERLGAMGLVPGVTLRLLQKRPAYVVQVGETEIAVDHDLAAEIFVRPD